MFAQKMNLVGKQRNGHTYTRFNKRINAKEYLSYAGGNESMHTDNPSYFSRDLIG